jgi:tetratricopeptide (TPR) repeat protein
MDQNERAISEDDDHAAVTTGNNSPWPRVNFLESLRAARKALTSWLKGGSDRQAKRATKAGIAMYNANLLDKAIGLGREALALQPPGHPDRATSCANLGRSLRVRYEQTGDVALLDEAIELQREALTLHPPGHRYRATSCGNLALSLRAHYEQNGDIALLDEAIELHREALALRPLGHPHRATSCANLGRSLRVRYEQTGDVALLDEAIKLEREALVLRPPGHPYRAKSCADLAASLRVRYQKTGDAVLLDEAMETCIHASEHSSLTYEAWYPLTELSRLHLLRNSPHYSVAKALGYLQQSFQREVGDIINFTSHVYYNIALMWDNSTVWNSHITALLVDVYAKMVDRLPLVAGLVLDTSSRLQSLKLTRQIGSDACVAALIAEQSATAVTLIDRAHGVVWSQALRQRDPQMEGAPASLSAELEGLLGEIATRPPVDPAGLPDQRDDQDLRYRQNTRIQTILRQIRAMPGLSYFMLGSTYDTLREVARDHPVVVLVAARDRAFAVIMSGAGENEPHALGLTLTSDDLLALRGSAEQAGLRSRADTRDGNTDERLGIHMSKMNVKHQPLRVLADIWRKIVKPVIDHLQLEVCSDKGMYFPPVDTSQTEGYWPFAAPSSLVCQRRLCLPSDTRGGHIHGTTSQPGALLRFRRLFLHSHYLGSTPCPEVGHSDQICGRQHAARG